jgi:predicted methyltransferase
MLSSDVKQSKMGIVLDPMCGMGYTAQAAIKYGLAFRGNELNSVRLQKTIDRLHRDCS